MSVVASDKVLVSPQDIERELVRIWRETAATDIATTEDPGTRFRTILSNFILLSFGQEDKVDDLITELCIAHPSRFFIIHVLPESEFHTRVSSRCVLARSGTHVCSEEVHITVGTRGAPVLKNLLTSLLVPDVLAVLTVLGDPFQQGDEHLLFFREIRSLADIILYDSLSFRNYFHGAVPFSRARTREEAPTGRPRTRVRDLNWYRGERWRMATAEQFDAVRLKDAARDIRSLRLACSSKDEFPGKSFLYAGWFLSSLHWTPLRAERSNDGWKISCSTPADTSTTLMFASESGAAHEHLRMVEIEVEQEKRNYHLVLERVFAEETLQVSCTQGGALPNIRKVPFPMESIEELILQPIHSSGIDDYFTKSLERSLDIAELIERERGNA